MAINYIYMLLDPRTYEKRYIGKAKDPEERYRKHLLPSYMKPDTYKNRWLRKLKIKNLKPILVIVSEVDSEIDDIDAEERAWIRRFRKAGHPLTNTTDGGDGGFCPNFVITDEIRAKMSASQKGRKWQQDDPRREQIRLRQTGKAPMQATNAATVKNSRDWEIISPDGDVYQVTNLRTFCKANELSPSKMYAVAKGVENRTHHRRWKCKEITK